MQDILIQIKDIRDSLRLLSEKINQNKKLIVHNGNAFNKKFSVILDAFEDFSVFAERLDENIKESIKINRIIQQCNKLEDKSVITKEGQILRRQVDRLDRFNRADFRALYIFSKRLLDQYIDLISFTLSFETKGVNFKNRYGNPSVTTLFRSISSNNSDEKIVIDFKNSCLNRFKAVDVFLTQYRDQYIVHQNVDGSVGTWFLNEMDGNIRFLAQRPSISPVELIFVVRNFVIDSVNFIINFDEVIQK